MGNQPSKNTARSTAQTERVERHVRQEKDKNNAEKDVDAERQRDTKMMARRISFQALSHRKATAADPSPSTEIAIAQTILQPPAHKPTLQQHLQPTQSESPEKNGDHNTSVAYSKPSNASSASPNGIHPVLSNLPGLEAEPSGPMDVPGVTADSHVRRDKVGSASSKSTPQASSSTPPHYTPMPGYKRPPRLPLAIADEIHAPESPSLEPTTTTSGEVSIFDEDEPETQVPRKSSMLSSATVDDDDEASELQPYTAEGGAVKIVPTRIDWKGKGDKVYVTGTFAHWDKKFRLHGSETGGMTATIGFPPGTHHLKFIVDGEMVQSPDLPTTVDVHNVLVNYIEVVNDEPSKDRRVSSQKMKPPPTYLYPPIALPPEDEFATGQITPEQPEDLPEPLEEEIPVGDFRQLVPQALIDMELPEHDPRFRQAYNIINDTPGPPSLPLFLGKSILNGILPHKDDNSVLTLPNHTVLNHLATSSIKNGVLATSVTTRYKKKYVTTIMYKPTVEGSHGS